MCTAFRLKKKFLEKNLKFFVRERKCRRTPVDPHLQEIHIVLHEEEVVVVVVNVHIMIEEEITTEIDPETVENEIVETNDVVDRVPRRRL